MNLSTIITTQKDNYLIAQLDRGTANALNQDMVNDLHKLVEYAENDNSVGGLILTGKPHFFSGGVDLLEVYDYDSAATRHFWGSFLQLAAKLVAFPKPLVAAITGHSPAGGCVLACACDYRVMARGEKYRIGLNEMAVGIAPRQSILELYAFWIGKRKAYQYLLEGYLMSGQEAFILGLVDELSDLDQTLELAEVKMKQYLKLPQQAFQQTKKSLKAELLRDMTGTFDSDLDALHKQLMSDESRMVMGQVVEFLKTKK